MTTKLAQAITATCRANFGRIVIRLGNRQIVDNRCDACPLRAPCLAFGAAPARTFEELAQARRDFNAAAEGM